MEEQPLCQKQQEHHQQEARQTEKGQQNRNGAHKSDDDAYNQHIALLTNKLEQMEKNSASTIKNMQEMMEQTLLKVSKKYQEKIQNNEELPYDLSLNKLFQDQTKQILKLRKQTHQLRRKLADYKLMENVNKNLQQKKLKLEQTNNEFSRKIAKLQQENSKLKKQKQDLSSLSITQKKQLQKLSSDIKLLRSTLQKQKNHNTDKLKNDSIQVGKISQILNSLFGQMQKYLQEQIQRDSNHNSVQNSSKKVSIPIYNEEPLNKISNIVLSQIIAYRQYNKQITNMLNYQKRQKKGERLMDSEGFLKLKEMKVLLLDDKKQIKTNEKTLLFSNLTAEKTCELLQLLVSQLGEQSEQLQKAKEQSKQIQIINNILANFSKMARQALKQKSVIILDKKQYGTHPQTDNIVKSINSLISALITDKQKLNSQKNKLNQIIKSTEQKNKLLSQQIISYKRKLSQTRNSLQIEKNTISNQLQLQKKQSVQELRNKQQEILELNKKLEQLGIKNKQMEINISNLQTDINGKMLKIGRLEQQIQKQNINYNKLKEEKQKFEVGANKFEALLSNTLSETTGQIIVINRDNQEKSLKNLKSLLLEKLNIPKFLVESKIYSSLPNTTKAFIQKQINNLLFKKISASKTIHETDPNSSSMQWIKKIMGRPNILMLLKMTSGCYVAGFSQQPYSNAIKKQGLGFLMSLTNKKKYSLKRRPDASILKYGPYYLTFGNDQLVIKANGVLTSIFGTAQTYFDSQGDRLQALFGQYENREMNFSELQFHELFFDDR